MYIITVEGIYTTVMMVFKCWNQDESVLRSFSRRKLTVFFENYMYARSCIVCWMIQCGIRFEEIDQQFCVA